MVIWPYNIDRFDRQYDKAFTKYPLSGADLIDRIHNCVQVFLHPCNTTSTEDVESGALKEFGWILKKVEIGYWITMMLVWVDRPTPKGKGRRKLDGHGSGYRMRVSRGGKNLVHNIGVNPQLQVMERFGEIISAARSEKLFSPMTEDGMDICLQYHSKGECVRQCTLSHAPLWGQIRENIIRYIGNSRAAHDPSRNRKFNG